MHDRAEVPRASGSHLSDDRPELLLQLLLGELGGKIGAEELGRRPLLSGGLGSSRPGEGSRRLLVTLDLTPHHIEDELVADRPGPGRLGLPLELALEQPQGREANLVAIAASLGQIVVDPLGEVHVA